MDNTTEQKPQWQIDLEAVTARFEALAIQTGINAQAFIADLRQDRIDLGL